MQDPPETSAGPCRVLIDGQEQVFDDLDALVRAAPGLGLQPATRVSLPGRRGWVAARSVPALAAVLADDDPWAVWDAVEDEPVSRPPAPAPAPPPAAAPVPELDSAHVNPIATPVGSRENGRQRFVVDSGKAAPKAAPAPPVSAPPVSAPAAPAPAARAAAQSGPGERGKVIAFPTLPGAPVAGPHALQPIAPEPLSIPLVEVAPPPPPTGGTRWGRLVAFAVVVFVFMGSATAWVRHHASQSFDAPLRPRPQAAAPSRPGPTPGSQAPPPMPAAAAAPAAPGGGGPTDELSRLEDELRARMRPRPQEVSATASLEDALYVELSRMSLRRLRVEAQVLTWAGRKVQEPKVAEVVVRFESAGELDRELAAIGLVMGKYVQAYGIEVPRFEAIVEGLDELPRRQSIDAERARLFYVERIGVVDFLRGMHKPVE